MSVLVAAASRHGATQEIATRIGEVIHGQGFPVDVMKLTDPPEYGPRPDPADYAAVVLGSAVYLGHWLRPARDFVRDNRDVLNTMPVWAFSSGPMDGQSLHEEQELNLAGVVATVNPREHRIFGGRIDRQRLSLPERALVSVIRAGDEDQRDWHDIDTWAEHIAQQLHALPTVLSPPRPAGRRAG